MLEETVKSRVKQAKKESKAVFTGKVLEIIENTDDSYITVKLKVLNSWKGKLTNEITVLTGIDDGNCRYQFEVNKTYLVYAYNGTTYSSEESFETTQCTRTTDVSEATEDIKLLDKGKNSHRSKIK